MVVTGWGLYSEGSGVAPHVKVWGIYVRGWVRKRETEGDRYWGGEGRGGEGRLANIKRADSKVCR